MKPAVQRAIARIRELRIALATEKAANAQAQITIADNAIIISAKDAQIALLQEQLVTAQSNDAADAVTIAETRAALDAQTQVSAASAQAAQTAEADKAAALEQVQVLSAEKDALQAQVTQNATEDADEVAALEAELAAE